MNVLKNIKKEINEKTNFLKIKDGKFSVLGGKICLKKVKSILKLLKILFRYSSVGRAPDCRWQLLSEMTNRKFLKFREPFNMAILSET